MKWYKFTNFISFVVLVRHRLVVMAMLLSRKILFYNKLGRELHKSVLVFSTSKDTVFKDTMDVKDVKPAIINTILTSPELAELPEVSWEKNVRKLT